MGFGVVGAVVKGSVFVALGFEPVLSSAVIDGFFGDAAVAGGLTVSVATGLVPITPAAFGSTAGLSGTDGNRCARISAART